MGRVFGSSLKPWWAYAAVAAVGVVVSSSVAVAAILVITPFTARRTFRLQRNLHDRFGVTWDAAGMSTETPRGRSTMAWGDYVRWRENGSVVLLYHSDNLFQFLPKRVLDVVQVDDMRAHAAAAGLKGAAGRR